MLLVFNALFCLAGGWYVGAAPVRLTEPTSDGEPAYVPSPRGRGTIDIFLSSIITLTLCVYTSIHLNITPKRMIFGIPSVWVYKFYWVLIAVFAPEFVLYAAYIQWRNAQLLCQKLKKLDGLVEPTMQVRGLSVLMSWIFKLRGRKATTEQIRQAYDKLLSGNQTDPVKRQESSNSNSGRPAPRWRDINMVSAFYIVMGGFAYEVDDLSDHYRYIALTPHGFMEFAKAGLITPECLNNDDIADRSKADSLGKLLVCMQALWLVINCIARKASGKPTTLVELNVIVHVVVAVIVYALWWHKPLAVAVPTLLQRAYATEHPSESFAEHDRKMVEPGLLALLVLQNYKLRIKLQKEVYEFDSSTTAESNHKYFTVDFKPYIIDTSKLEIRLDTRYTAENAKKCMIVPAADRKIKSPSFLLLEDQFLVFKDHRVCVRNRKGHRAIVVTSKLLATMESACAYVRGILKENNKKEALREILGLEKNTTTDPPNYSVHGSIYLDGLLSDTDILDNWPMMVIFTILSCFYAGSHASAWSSHFPTYIERWIWRGACIAIASTIPVGWSLVRFFVWLEERSGNLTSYWELINGLSVLAFFVTGFLALAIYLLARLYIPAEAFISMRSLPIGAFETVDWVEFWPHV
jgi:hypothetical protein